MAVLIFIKDLFIATFVQMAALLGVVFLFGFVINFISHMIFRSIEKSFWSRGTYVVAWLGTPIHELGHALFCLIFGHRIEKMELFHPDPVTGTLGYVSHTWNRKNPYQVLGNVFISAGPVILGGSVLFALFFFLIPDSSFAWDKIIAKVGEIQNISSISSYLEVLGASSFSMAGLIFTTENLAGWRFWVFAYLSICVASNIRLSWADIRGALRGMGYFVLLFLLFNLIGRATSFGPERLFQLMAPLLGLIYSLLIVALIMTVFGFVLVYLITAVYVRITRKYLLNPFWG